MHSDPTSRSPTSRWQTAHWHGRYSDGQTAGSVIADLRLTDRGIEIAGPGATAPLVWPYGGLGVATPVSPKATDVLVTYSYMPGATLFVNDPTFVRALTEAAPQLTASSYGWRAARPWIAAAAAVVLVGVAVWVSDLSPARWVAGQMPDTLRRSIGDQVVAAVSDRRRVCTQPAGRAALDRLVKRLSQATGTSKRFDVRVIDWKLFNAFAAPGEQIVLTREIIQKARSPDEMAGVLAHEMGHGLSLHPEAGIVRVIGLTAATELLLTGAGALANIGILLTQFSYTRAAEREADDRGLAMLKNAGISADGLIDFFQRVGELENKVAAGSKQSSSGQDGSEPSGRPSQTKTGWGDLLRSHPRPAERAERAARRPKYPATPAMSAVDWQALRQICNP